VKIRSVKANNRRRVFEVRVGAGVLPFPYSKVEPAPGLGERVVRVAVDEELAREAFGFELGSGRSGTVHVEQVLEYNQDPSYMRDLLLYKLTLEAQARVAGSPLSKREIVRRLGTSAAQLYRLLDQTNEAKSIDQMLNLLRVLDCEVDLVVRARTA
jgi:hypothetical protein